MNTLDSSLVVFGFVLSLRNIHSLWKTLICHQLWFHFPKQNNKICTFWLFKVCIRLLLFIDCLKNYESNSKHKMHKCIIYLLTDSSMYSLLKVKQQAAKDTTTTQPILNLNCSWVWHENDFAFPPILPPTTKTQC